MSFTDVINYFADTVLEWIPYNQFIDIKEIRKNGLFILYLANGNIIKLQRNVKGVLMKQLF